MNIVDRVSRCDPDAIRPCARAAGSRIALSGIPLSATFPRATGALLGGLLLVICVAGCGERQSAFAGKLVPATGVVTLDGRPLGGAQISFVPDFVDGQRAFAISDAEGRFELSTVPAGRSAAADTRKGAMPGPYRVSILKFETRDGSAPPPDVPPMEAGAVNVLPERYARGEAIQATVSEQGDEFAFALQSRR